MYKKFTISYVKEFASKSGYECLSNNYVNTFSKLKFRCPMNHLFSMEFNEFKRGCRCPYCYEKTRRNTINDVKKYIKQFGYLCLTKKEGYILSYDKLKFKCSLGHVYESRWDHFKQGSRCPICRSINMTGENNPRWKGGIACEPYCDTWLDEEYKQAIKQRDNNKCLNPLCNKNSERICLHHIDYNKKNCHPNNLITLCISCNSKANKDRTWHESWYKAILYRRYCIV